jgi:hypothetical protein
VRVKKPGFIEGPWQFFTNLHSESRWLHYADDELGALREFILA